MSKPSALVAVRSLDAPDSLVAGPGAGQRGVAYRAELAPAALPAVPLTASAGYLFGAVEGTAIVLFSATIAAGVSFLIGRSLLRSWVERVAGESAQFQAIDRAVASEGFKIILLLRLSPIFPFALSNYFYGLTAVEFGPYLAATLLADPEDATLLALVVSHSFPEDAMLRDELAALRRGNLATALAEALKADGAGRTISTTASSKRSVMPMTSKCVATTALAHATPPAAVYSQQTSASFASTPPIHSVKLSFFAAELISPHHAPARRK